MGGDGARPRGAAHKICLHSPEKKSCPREKKRKKKGEQGRRRFVWISEERTAKNKGGAENGGGIEGEEKEKDELSRREEVLARKETNERTNKQTNK